MPSQKILQYVEIDVDYCSLSYGIAPCQAQLGSGSTDGTKILLHMDGADASTTFTDSNTAGSAHTWTAHGNAQIDTADSKFGGASVFFDGTGDYVDTPDHADFDLGATASGDWTVDFWFKVNSTGTYIGFCGQSDATPTAAGSSFYIQRDPPSSDKIQSVAFVGGVSSSILSLAGYNLSSNPGWHHFAFLRDGGFVRQFIDGVHQGSAAISGAVNNSAGKFAVGALGDYVAAPMSGWIDEFRLSNFARWTGTASFTPPNGPAGQTGTKKCFNTLATCQDRDNFTNDPVTLRFAVPTADLPTDVECIPSIKTITFDPATVSLGQNLGQRATLTITFDDHRHSDTGAGFDKYHTERTYDPYQQGTFWGKFRSRQTFLRGRSLRWIVGTTEQSLSEMETRHYIIDSFSGPDNNGLFKLIAKDLLKLADGDRALAPAVSEGFLVADITNVATSLTVSPTGIGATYPDSGYVNIGGTEIVSYTKGGIDTYTVLLLHCDGADASTTFTDASTYAHGNATVNGNAQVDTAFFKFSTGGALFDGTGDYLTFPNSADWEFGSGDFTIDWWERRTSATAAKTTAARDPTTTFVPWIIGYSDGTDLLFYATSNGSSWDIADGKSMGSIELNVFHHFAVVRKGDTFYLFKDGVIQSTFTSSLSFAANSGLLSIGRCQSSNDFTGTIDEFRISKGVARWTSPFTPPAIAYASGTDTFTIARAQLGTVASAHSTQDRVQLCLRYAGVGPDDIIFGLLHNFANVESQFLPLEDWHLEISSYLNRVYTATVAQPLAVNMLISELIEQAGLSMWWDDRNQEIGMLVLRGLIYTNDFFDDNNMIADTLQIVEQPDKRLSQVHTYFGQINPITSLTDKANYRSVSKISDAQAESDYGSAAIKEIFSRWIPNLGRSVADRLGNILLSRFSDPPRKISFSLLRNSMQEIVLANGYQLQGWPLQQDTGEPATVNVQVTRMRPSADLIELETEEVLFPVTAAEDLTIRNIIVDANNFNLNLRDAHDLIYPTPTAGITVILTINSGVKVGSTINTQNSVDIGNWPVGVTIVVHIVGRIQGKGGGGWSYNGNEGQNGGVALYTRYAINLSCPGQIYGGGGGGGGGSYNDGSTGYYWGGGGGAGFNVGLGGQNALGAGGAFGANGTTEAGGAGSGYGGAGGGPGANGAAGSVGGTPGGTAGAAIDGVSFCTKGTWDGTTFTPTGSITGTIAGSQIN